MTWSDASGLSSQTAGGAFAEGRLQLELNGKLPSLGTVLVDPTGRFNSHKGDAMFFFRDDLNAGKEKLLRRFAANLGDEDKDGEAAGGDAAIRREMAGAGQWLPVIVTDAQGKATAKFTLPNSASEWRLTARGGTVQTLVGQATAKVVTRKDFFVSLKAPARLQEGDSLRALGRVHNLTDYEGEVNLTLQLLGGEAFDKKLSERKATVKITKQGVAEVLMDAIEIPLTANVRLQLPATAGDKLTDTLARTFPVRPWGWLAMVDHHRGSEPQAISHRHGPGQRPYAVGQGRHQPALLVRGALAHWRLHRQRPAGGHRRAGICPHGQGRPRRAQAPGQPHPHAGRFAGGVATEGWRLGLAGPGCRLTLGRHGDLVLGPVRRA